MTAHFTHRGVATYKHLVTLGIGTACPAQDAARRVQLSTTAYARLSGHYLSSPRFDLARKITSTALIVDAALLHAGARSWHQNNNISNALCHSSTGLIASVAILAQDRTRGGSTLASLVGLVSGVLGSGLGVSLLTQQFGLDPRPFFRASCSGSTGSGSGVVLGVGLKGRLRSPYLCSNGTRCV